MPRLALLLLAVVVTTSTGCGDADPEEASGAADRVSAVAAAYPLAWVAERVASESDVTLLTAGGLEAHDLDLSPGQRTAIEGADVVLFLGDIGFQPQVEDAVRSASGEVVSLAEVAGKRVLEPPPDPHGDEPAAGEHGEEVAVDPHMWFDPGIIADVARRTARAFAAADADNAAAYRRNAAAVADELGVLGTDLDKALGGECRFDEAIVSHQAYGYLLRPYGHAQHGITGVNPEAGASSGDLAELVAEIKREGIGHVLAEPVEGRADAQAVAREAGVALLDVSPLDAVSQEQARAGLPDLVRQQAHQFATALGCPR